MVAASRSASASLSAQTAAQARMAYGVGPRRRRLEPLAIAQHRGDRVVIGEMMREGKPGADHGGELRAVAARAEQPDRRQRDVLRHGAHVAERMAFRKGVALEQQQLLEALQEIVVVAGILAPPQRVGGHGIGAGRAADAEIDAAGKQRLQHLEALGDHQRRMVGQHDAAGADADAPRSPPRSGRS